MKLFVILLTCTIFGAAIGGGVYWYGAEGRDLIKQIRRADHKPFFFD